MSFLRDDPELLARFRAGDRAAMGVVHDECLPSLEMVLDNGFTILSSGVRVPPVTNPDDRADLIQQVLMRVCRKETRLAYDGTRDFKPYFLTIARHEIVSFYRKRGRELASSD